MSRSSSSKIFSWVVAVTLFALCAVALDYVWTRFVIDTNPASEAGRIHHLMEEHGSEIPVFGASKAYNDYIPYLLGPDVFNYGMNGTSLDGTLVLLQIECAKPKRTPIILDLTHFGLRGVGDVAKFLPYTNRSDVQHVLKESDPMGWRYWIPGLRYFGYYDQYLKEYITAKMSHSRKTLRGYSFDVKPKPFNPDKLKESIRLREKAGYWFSSYPDQDQVLFDLIKSTPNRIFVIIFSPVHPSCFTNFKYAEDFACYKEKLRSFPNVVVLDWGQSHYPDDYFTDTVHLNEKGAQDFSRRLAVELQAIRAGALTTPNSK